MEATFLVIIYATMAGFSAFLIRLGGRIITRPGSIKRDRPLSGDFGDAMTHILLADMIRRNGMRLPKVTPAFELSGAQTYPAGFHWLIALLPKVVVERREWLCSPTIEAFNAVATYTFAYFVVSEQNESDASKIAYLITLFWLLTPGLSIEPRRGGYLNERVFGFLFSNTYFISAALWMWDGHWSYAVIACLSIVVAAISSKFGMQAILFITPMWSLLVGEYALIGLLLVALVVTMLITKGYSLYVWRGSLEFSLFYASYLSKVHDYVSSFSARTLVVALLKIMDGDIRSGVRMFAEHPLVKGVLAYPVVFGVLIFALLADIQGGMFQILNALCLASVLVFLATTTDTLKFLGEAERYLEISVVASLLIAVIVAQAHWGLVGLVIGAYSGFRVLRSWSRLRVRDLADNSFCELVDYLRREPGRLMLTLPGRLCYPIAYNMEHHRFMWWFINRPAAAREQCFKALFTFPGRYPYPTPDAVTVALPTGEVPSLFVMHIPTAQAIKRAWGISYDNIEGEVVFRNKAYCVISVN